uniref:CCHC-type domain-containing protein n=2 Tax=Macrostomum lignano TaxID=282301 RepID=A0A1I8IXJ3_9PLAT
LITGDNSGTQSTWANGAEGRKKGGDADELERLLREAGGGHSYNETGCILSLRDKTAGNRWPACRERRSRGGRLRKAPMPAKGVDLVALQISLHALPWIVFEQICMAFDLGSANPDNRGRSYVSANSTGEHNGNSFGLREFQTVVIGPGFCFADKALHQISERAGGRPSHNGSDVVSIPDFEDGIRSGVAQKSVHDQVPERRGPLKRFKDNVVEGANNVEKKSQGVTVTQYRPAGNWFRHRKVSAPAPTLSSHSASPRRRLPQASPVLGSSTAASAAAAASAACDDDAENEEEPTAAAEDVKSVKANAAASTSAASSRAPEWSAAAYEGRGSLGSGDFANEVRRLSSCSQFEESRRGSSDLQQKAAKTKKKSIGPPAKRCYRCLSQRHLAAKCPFINSKCYACSKTGHIAAACKAAPPAQRDERSAGPQRASNRRVDSTVQELQAEEADEEAFSLHVMAAAVGGKIPPIKTTNRSRHQQQVQQHPSGQPGLKSLLDKYAEALQKEQHDAHAHDRRINVGDSVLARDFARDGRWRPATVTDSSGAADFTCRFDDGRDAHRHVDQVRKPAAVSQLPTEPAVPAAAVPQCDAVPKGASEVFADGVATEAAAEPDAMPQLRRSMRKGEKFGFLSRRSTDTTAALEKSSSLRPNFKPSSDQVQRWGASFDCLLNDKYGLALFRAFLKTEYSDENIEFWIACEEYRGLIGLKKQTLKAQKIYTEFVAFQAPREHQAARHSLKPLPTSQLQVNLDSTTRLATINAMGSPDSHLFEQAQKRIQALMEKDSYQRFLRSEVYQALVKDAPTSAASTDENAGGATAAQSSTV